MNLPEDAVSEVVGEMLLIAIVLILVSLVGISIYNLVPAERDPYVTIKMKNTTDSVTLYHKGGDWVRKSDLTVIIRSQSYVNRINSADPRFILNPDVQSFDLNATITVSCTPHSGDEVQLVTPRAVLFSGRVP